MRRKASPEDRGRLSFWHRVEREARSKRRHVRGYEKALPRLRAHYFARTGGDGSFLPIGEVQGVRGYGGTPSWSRPQDSRQAGGGARLLTIGLEGCFLPFEEGQARHSIPRTVPLSTASPKKAAETRHTIPSKEGNAPLSTVTIYSIKEGIREIPVNMKREPLPLPAPKIGTHVRNTPNARRRTGEHDEKATAREGRGQPLKPILLCSGCTGPT